MVAHQLDVFRLQDAAFGHDALARRNVGQQVQRVLQAGLEGAQVAVVDAQQRRLHGQRHVQFLGVVHFHQHVHAELHRQRFVVAQL
ncbi:hypothetical protein D3C78_1819860 [compost metagenome]